jgi:hypothetical protein
MAPSVLTPLRASKMAKKKSTLYVDIDERLKRRLARLADHRHRKLTAEVALMVEKYLDAEERAEKLPPLPEEDE